MSCAKPKLIVLLLLAATAIGSTASGCKSATETSHAWFKVAPSEDNAVFEKVLEYRSKKDFDNAAAEALKGVGEKGPDDFLLQTVADTYFERAQADPANRKQWVELAVRYSEQALKKNPQDVVNTFNVGESYLSAGMNLQKPEACDYYAKSVGIFQQLRNNSTLKNEAGIIEGKQVQLEPYRRRLDQKIQQAQTALAGCSGPGELR